MSQAGIRRPGRRGSRRRSWVLLLLLLLAAGLSWRAARDAAGGAPLPVAAPAAELLRVEKGSASESLVSSPLLARQPVAREDQPTDQSSRDDRGARHDTSALVRVTGRVLRAGRPAALCDLSFHAPDQTWRDNAVDWSLTDRHGRYEVALPAATYVVREAATPWTTLVVLQGASELAFDVHLPP